jgi:DNA ligase-1
MLAVAASEQYLESMRYPVLASPKIDGVRAMIVNGVVTSRSGKPIPNRYVQRKYGIPQLNGYDGELVVGSPVDRNCMQHTMSGVMSHDGEPTVNFWIFDRWDIGNQPYFERLGAITEIPELQVYRLDHTRIHDYSHLQSYETLQTSRGYEGIMLRGYNNKYKHGRSTLREGGLIKVKRFCDSEAIIVGFEPLYRNENAATKNELGYTERSTHQANKFADELLGSITVRDMKTKVTFDIGSGFDMSQRERLWKDPNKLIGRIVKYKSFSVGVVDKPRFPIFLGFRDPIDM